MKRNCICGEYGDPVPNNRGERPPQLGPSQQQQQQQQQQPTTPPTMTTMAIGGRAERLQAEMTRINANRPKSWQQLVEVQMAARIERERRAVQMMNMLPPPPKPLQVPDEIRKQVDSLIKSWSEDQQSGTKRPLRELLVTFYTVLWPGAKWKQISSIEDIIDNSKAKKQYFKATLVVHPDKTSHFDDIGRKYLAMRIFDVLCLAKHRFDKTESMIANKQWKERSFGN